jgi:AhpD family alkylhydroperoxidase
MASIVYSICGEGRGHATRARADRTLEPNRSYWASWLWRSLMGNRALAVSETCRRRRQVMLRCGAHFCSRSIRRLVRRRRPAGKVGGDNIGGKAMKRLARLVCSVMVLLAAGAANAQMVKDAAEARAEVQKMFGFVPGFIKAIPDVALPGAWEEMKTLQMSTTTALSGKQKELIGLAVASQIPCEYCVYAHTEFAKLNGATPGEIGDAIAMAGLTRHWSTFLNGLQPDETKFKADVAKSLDHMKKMMSGKGPAPKPVIVVDAKTAKEDMIQSFGPAMAELFAKFPPEALAAAWREEKDVELAQTALDAKTKSLASIAVAAQIPCRYCVIADTEFAKLGGASEREILETLAMASHVRNWSTLLNGLQVDKVAFKKDVDKLVKNIKKSAPKSASR